MPYSRRKLLALTFLVEGIAFIIAFILAKVFGIKLLPLTNHLFRDIILGTLGTIPPLLFFAFLVSEKAKDFPLTGPLRKLIINDLSLIFSETKLLDLFVISILAGFAEEFLFRGLIQAKLGIIAASIIFGLLHFVTPAYCVFATIMGFYLGFLFHYYQGLLIPVQIHFIYDLAALVYLRYYVKPTD